ncbi:O-antigen ligase family protein [Sphingomonas sp.]|jgi:O-antigen ligase|uniref:O-antigen ligase family protein n=1 Tax=Sphingomonas sp. TaxID=28214 RepID=UPI00262F0364|nr:O-antigen ligase family protein [Sphingomonas sp.]MDK2769548.1 O-antigen ligase family protein [Sphingomonas sp.]
MLYAALAVLVAAILFGGASRIETGGAFLTRLVTLGAFVWLVWQRGSTAIRIERPAALIWFALIALVLVQLIPLPYSVWTALPGRDLAKAAVDLVGEQPWGAISLTPMRTLDTLLMLLGAFVAYVIGAQLDASGRTILLNAVLGLMIVSALLALAQVGSGSQSPLYFYAITNRDAGVGFFSNANHLANFLSGGIVLVGWWLAQRASDRRAPSTGELFTAGLTVLLFLAAIFTTTSRAGTVFALVALGFAFTLLPLRQLGVSRRLAFAGAGVGFAVGATVVALLLTGVLGSGAFTFTGGESERVALVPQLLGIARDFLPFGTGVGSFDQIYRSYETRDGLQFAYLNQAHNEYLQILIEFGIFGVAALVAGLIWYARRAWQAFRVEPESRTVNRQQRAAAMVIVFVVVHSAGDYPLRTDGFAVYFALLCALLTPPITVARRNGGRIGRASGPRIDNMNPGLSYSSSHP